MTTPNQDEPILKRRSTPRHNRGGAWALRLLLAACLFFASEIVLWTEITRPVVPWLLLIPGYVALGALLLDLSVRFRVRDLFGGLVLAGTYGILAGTVLNPTIALASLPISLLTRVMGAQTVAGGIGIALFLALLGRGGPRSLLIGSAFAGAFWGVWARGYSVLLGTPEVTLPIVIAIAVGALLLIIGTWATVTRLTIEDPTALRLSRVEWGVISLVIAALTVTYMLRGPVTRDAFSYIVLLLFFCAVILWFQSNRGETSLLTGLLPPTLSRFGIVVIAGVMFVVIGAGTFLIPPSTGDDLGVLQVISVVFGAIGLAWLPAVCVVLGVRAYRQSARTGKEL